MRRRAFRLKRAMAEIAMPAVGDPQEALMTQADHNRVVTPYTDPDRCTAQEPPHTTSTSRPSSSRCVHMSRPGLGGPSPTKRQRSSTGTSSKRSMRRQSACSAPSSPPCTSAATRCERELKTMKIETRMGAAGPEVQIIEIGVTSEPVGSRDYTRYLDDEQSAARRQTEEQLGRALSPVEADALDAEVEEQFRWAAERWNS